MSNVFVDEMQKKLEMEFLQLMKKSGSELKNADIIDNQFDQ